MQNVGGEQFDYGTFKAAYDTDERVKAMVKDFSKYGIEPKTKVGGEDETPSSTGDGSSVDQMAKSATDVGAKL